MNEAITTLEECPQCQVFTLPGQCCSPKPLEIKITTEDIKVLEKLFK